MTVVEVKPTDDGNYYCGQGLEIAAVVPLLNDVGYVLI